MNKYERLKKDAQTLNELIPDQKEREISASISQIVFIIVSDMGNVENSPPVIHEILRAALDVKSELKRIGKLPKNMRINLRVRTGTTNFLD